jgi:hypothetical protein
VRRRIGLGQGSLLGGSGGSAPGGFQMPSVGNYTQQAQAGYGLVQQIIQATSNPSSSAAQSLLAAGIALASSAIGGGPGGQMLSSVLGGALTGLATVGPMGAAAAGISAAISSIASLGQPADQVVDIVTNSQATQVINGRIQARASKNPALVTGKPQGWAMADYMATAFPPSKTNNPKKFISILQSYAKCLASSGPQSTLDPKWYYAQAGVFHPNYDPTNLTNVLCVDGATPPQFAGNCNRYTTSQFVGWQKPLCTPVFFLWNQSSQIVDCSQDLLFGSGGAGGDATTLLQRWTSSVYPLPGMTQQQIVQYAIARAPDPLYWGADLYGSTQPSGAFSSGWQTVYWQPDLLNAMATVLMMLSSGASTQAIVSELLIQSYILQQLGGIDPTGAKVDWSSCSLVGFHQLIDDYITLANQQNAQSPAQIAAEEAGTLSPAAAVGAFMTGASGMALAMILAYSAFTRTSPVTVTRSAMTRASRIGRFFR